MTNIPEALERSLREGPPDERGYRAAALDFSTEAPVVSRLGVRARRSSVPLGRRSTRAIPIFSALDSVALLTAAVVVAFVLLRGAVPSGPGGSPEPPTPSAPPRAALPTTDACRSGRSP